MTALISDFTSRGMLEDTLVLWGGEFGRTSMMEARGGLTFLGRDHHPRAFTMLFSGGGLNAGLDYGESDDFGYFITKNEMTVRDLQATVLYLLGLDAQKLSYPYLGLDQRLIGQAGKARVHHEIISWRDT